MKNSIKERYNLLNKKTISCTNGKTFYVDSIFSYTTNACLFKVIKDGKEYIAKVISSVKSHKKWKNVRRFENEGIFLAENRVKHVVEALGYGEYEATDYKFYFYIMPKFDGSYRDLLNDIENYNIEKRIEWLYQIAIGIEELHNADVVHRDIKPENIFYRKADDKLYIGDLGISHFKGSDLTQKGEKLANFNYASPEQLITQKKNYDITKSTDVYSFGLIVNETFTGAIPRGNNYKKIGDIYPELCEFDEINNELLEMDPRLRLTNPVVAILKMKEAYQDYFEKFQDLHEFLSFDDNVSCDDYILYIAAKDILTIEKVMECDREKGEYLNSNYHSDIRYLVSPFALDTAYLLKIQEIVNNQFEYEANVDEGNAYIEKNVDKSSLEKLRIIVNNLKGSKQIRKFEIFKKFSSLRSYHCQEALRDISSASADYSHKKLFCVFELYGLFSTLKQLEQSNLGIAENVWLKEYPKGKINDDEIIFRDKKYKIDHNFQIKRVESELQKRLKDKDICILFESSEYHIYLNEKSFQQYVNLCEEKRKLERPDSVAELDIGDCERVNREIDQYKIISLGEYNFSSVLGIKILGIKDAKFFH